MAGYLPKPSVPSLNLDAAISKNVVGAWPFYETSPVITQDVSGRGHDGTLKTGTPTREGSSYGMAATYDISNYAANMGNNTDFSPGNGTTDTQYSWFVSCKITDLSVNNTLMSKDQTGTREFLFFITTSGQLRIFLFRYNTNNERIGRRTDAGAVVAGQDYNILCTYDGSATNEGFKLYLNGVRVDTTNDGGGDYNGRSDNKAVDMIIGARATSNFNPLIGSLHNAAIWKDRELSENDAQLLHHDPFIMYRQDDLSSWIAGALDTAVAGSPYYYYLQQQLLAG